MTLPGNVSTGTITGTLPDFTGAPARGRVIFTPEVSQLTAAPSAILVPAPITVTLDDQGHFSVALVATDDPDAGATGWTYRADFRIDNAQIPSFSFQVPSGSTLDLSTLVPVATSPGVITTARVPVAATANFDHPDGTSTPVVGSPNWAPLPSAVQGDLTLPAATGQTLELWSTLAIGVTNPSPDQVMNGVDLAVIANDTPVYYVGAQGPALATPTTGSTLSSGARALFTVQPGWVVDGVLRLRVYYAGLDVDPNATSIYGRLWVKNFG